MDIKILRLLGAIGVFLSMVSSTCKCGTGCAEIKYSFNINCKAYPDKVSINVGDTIWIEIKAPTQLHDEISGKQINYSEALNLGTAIEFLELKPGTISTPDSFPAANNFTFYTIDGNFIPDNPNKEKVKEFTLIEREGYYNYKVAFIPQKKGIYAIVPSNSMNVYRKNDKCTKASFNITFKDTEQHLYLYEKSRPGYTPSEYEKTYMYCFKVY